MSDTVSEGPARFRVLDFVVALVLAGFAAVYALFYVPFFVGAVSRGEAIGLAMLVPLAMAASAFIGLWDTLRVAGDPNQRPWVATPILLFGTAVMFVVHWVLGPRGLHFSGFGIGLVLLPGLLAAWSAVRLGRRWFAVKRVGAGR